MPDAWLGRDVVTVAHSGGARTTCGHDRRGTRIAADGQDVDGPDVDGQDVDGQDINGPDINGRPCG
jgi:hypothetical protein